MSLKNSLFYNIGKMFANSLHFWDLEKDLEIEKLEVKLVLKK